MGRATALAITTFILLVLFGEILPKSFVYSNARPLALAATVPVFFVVQVFGPIAMFFRILFRPRRGPRRRPATLRSFARTCPMCRTSWLR